MIVQLFYLIFIGLGAGYATWRLLGIDEDDSYAKLLLQTATGLGLFVLSSAVIGFLHLSNWFVYAGLTLILLLAVLRKGMPKIAMPKIERNWIIVIAFFLIHLYIYFTGAMAYPWLEDDDPWEHAAATRYVSIYATYIQPEHMPIHYLAPYPPFFDVLLGTIFQVDGSSLQFTLKFFNALLVSICIPLFYCWAKRKVDGRTALWATAILAVLPSFMSHFIWAQTLAMLLAISSFYFLDRYLAAEKTEKRKIGVLAVLMLAAVLITQPSVAGIIFIMVLLYVGATVLPAIMKKEANLVVAVRESAAVPAAALLLAILLFWGPMFVLYGADGVLEQLGLGLSFVSGGTAADTSGGIIYGLEDFLFAPSSSKMDQPTGWGMFVAILIVVGIMVSALRIKEGKEQNFHLLILLWFVFCMIGVEGNAMPYKMMPHRFWVFLALPVALLAGQGTVAVLEGAEKRLKSYAWIAIVVLVLGIFYTSAAPKIAVETSAWPPGTGWVTNEQIAGYIKLKELPPNAKLFSFCGLEKHADGIDKFGYAWEKEVADYKTASINDSVTGNYALLKKYGYEYAVIDHSCLLTNSPEEIQSKLNNILADSRFQLQEQFSGNGFIVFRVY